MSGEASPETGHDSTGRKVNTYVACIVALAAVVLGLSLFDRPDPAPEVWLLVFTFALFFLADLELLHVRFGHERHSFTWAEASVVVGVAVLPSPWLQAEAVIAVALCHVTIDRLEPKKLAFNVAEFAIGVVAARLIYGVLGGDTGLTNAASVRSCLALAAGSIFFSLWNVMSVGTVIALAQRRAFWEVVRKAGVVHAIACLGNTAAGITLILLIGRGIWYAFAFPLVLGLLFLLYLAYLRAAEERDVWQVLQASSRELVQLRPTEVAEVALEAAASLFRADVVELLLVDPSARSPHQRFQLTHNRISSRTLEALPTYWPRVAHEQEPAELHVATAGARIRDELVAEGLTVSFVEPLLIPGACVGALRLGFFGEVKMRRRERQVFHTLANQVTASLRMAELFEQMEDEKGRLEYLALHDSLTGMGNRNFLVREVERLIAAPRSDGAKAGLMLLDVDRFKEVNDTLGHDTGDVLLQQIGERLMAAAGPEDVVVRLGGDEYAVLVPWLDDSLAWEDVARRCLRAFELPFQLPDMVLDLSASVGLAVFPDHGQSVESLLQKAEVAMYEAKSGRFRGAVYSAGRDPNRPERLAMTTRLREAIEAGELEVHYQPKVALPAGSIVGFEALVRWPQRDGTSIPPDQFVPVAEKTGLIEPLTRYVLDRALQQLSEWRKAGNDIDVAVNISLLNLRDPALAATIEQLLVRWDVPARNLVLEVTETSVMTDPEETISNLRRVDDLGVRVALDDFGTGHSSLSHLQRLPVRQLKIDRSFVMTMTNNPQDTVFVRTIVDLAHNLGLETVAEGVETEATWTLLAELGCETAQGYYISRPAHPRDLWGFLERPDMRAV